MFVEISARVDRALKEEKCKAKTRKYAKTSEGGQGEDGKATTTTTRWNAATSKSPRRYREVHTSKQSDKDSGGPPARSVCKAVR